MSSTKSQLMVKPGKLVGRYETIVLSDRLTIVKIPFKSNAQAEQ
jgi:hypothetical protein